ncbi:MAG: formyltransferase family protein [Candidatus Omnitrophica bacterium]|nr:formyltransferase family protein [Candidatus Omnitrophota bacterium]
MTVHFVDELMDNGPIILQQALKIEETDTVETLEEKMHKIEHKIYPQAIQLFVEGKLKIEGRRVLITNPNL